VSHSFNRSTFGEVEVIADADRAAAVWAPSDNADHGDDAGGAEGTHHLVHWLRPVHDDGEDDEVPPVQRPAVARFMPTWDVYRNAFATAAGRSGTCASPPPLVLSEALKRANFDDGCGDGDQSPLPDGIAPNDRAEIRRGAWRYIDAVVRRCMDLGASSSTAAAAAAPAPPSHLPPPSSWSGFMAACFNGECGAVMAALTALPVAERRMRVMFRETAMRLSPLHAVIHGMVCGWPAEAAGHAPPHLDLLPVLLAEGADAAARDLLGDTPISTVLRYSQQGGGATPTLSYALGVLLRPPLTVPATSGPSAGEEADAEDESAAMKLRRRVLHDRWGSAASAGPMPGRWLLREVAMLGASPVLAARLLLGGRSDEGGTGGWRALLQVAADQAIASAAAPGVAAAAAAPAVKSGTVVQLAGLSPGSGLARFNGLAGEIVVAAPEARLCAVRVQGLAQPLRLPLKTVAGLLPAKGDGEDEAVATPVVAARRSATTQAAAEAGWGGGRKGTGGRAGAAPSVIVPLDPTVQPPISAAASAPLGSEDGLTVCATVAFDTTLNESCLNRAPIRVFDATRSLWLHFRVGAPGYAALAEALGPCHDHLFFTASWCVPRHDGARAHTPPPAAAAALRLVAL
jgi:hypothetical protein